MSSVFGLKARPNSVMVPPAPRYAAGGDDLFRHGALALVVDGGDGLDNSHRQIRVVAGLDERQRILGKTRAAVAWAGVKELAADAVVSTSRWSPISRVSSMLPVGITNACTSEVVPNNSRMTVTVHSAMNPRCGGAGTCAGGGGWVCTTAALISSTASHCTRNPCYPVLAVRQPGISRGSGLEYHRRRRFREP